MQRSWEAFSVNWGQVKTCSDSTNPFVNPVLSLRDLADPALDPDSSVNSSTVSELAEARRTTYLSGRWVWDDQNGDTSISITTSSVNLPSNGDCSAYYSWDHTCPGPGESRPALDQVSPDHTCPVQRKNSLQLINPLKVLTVNESSSTFVLIRLLSQRSSNLCVCLLRVGAHKPRPHHQRCSVLHHSAHDHPIPHPGHQPAQEALQQVRLCNSYISCS